jgi:hypothetical protein
MKTVFSRKEVLRITSLIKKISQKEGCSQIHSENATPTYWAKTSAGVLKPKHFI